MNNKSLIRCSTEKQFYDAIAQLAYRGIAFDANVQNLSIILL